MTSLSFANSVTVHCDWSVAASDMSSPRTGRAKQSAILAAIVLWGLSATVLAGDAPAYSIACRLDIERDPSLTPRLAEAVREQVRGVYQAVLGDEGAFRFLDEEAAAALPHGTLSALSEDAVVERWPGPERLLLVSLHRQGRHVVAQAREYDPHFQLIGPLCESRATQRDLAPDAAGRAALQAFSPTGEVRAVKGTTVQVEFLAGRRLQAYRSWLGISEDVGLQVMREPLSNGSTVAGAAADSLRPTRYRRTFLAVRHWGPDRADCELIGPDANLFRDLGDSSVRYLARPARAGREPTAVRVVRKDTRQPQEGCEVFVSAGEYSTEPSASRGVTDRDGAVRFEPDLAGIRFVSVRYEDMVLRAPLLPGASSNPLLFELRTRGRRTDVVRPLRVLYQELTDQILIDNRLHEELKARAAAKDVTEVRKLIAAQRQRNRVTEKEVASRVREVEERARSDGEDVAALATEVRELAAKGTTRSLDEILAAYTGWADRLDKQTTINALVSQIGELNTKMDWDALVPLYERLAEVDPDKPQWAEQLRRLRAALAVKGPEHEQAREFVDAQLKDVTVRNLANRWPEIEQAARTLLHAKDHLTVLKLQRSLTTWARDLVPEAKGVSEQLQAAGADEDRVRTLEDRLRQLTDLNEDIQKLHKELSEFLKKLEL